MKTPTKKLFRHIVVVEVRVEVWAENQDDAIDMVWDEDFNAQMPEVMDVEVDTSQYKEVEDINDNYDRADMEINNG
jgi:hypothetical protein